MATATAHLTTRDLLALPDDGMDRWLIAGELRERPMTKRNQFHSSAVAVLTAELVIWNRQQPPPRGKVLAGEAGVWLAHDPDTAVGVDVVYISGAVAAAQTRATTLIDGIPTLVAEVLSPSDRIEDIHEKVEAYRAAGVPLIWILDPYPRTVTVYRPGGGPALFNADQVVSADPHLPGFTVPVARLFE